MQILKEKNPTKDIYFYELKDFKELRKNKNCFKQFVELYLSIVITKHEYDMNKNKFLLQDYCTVSSEAFTLLILENNWEMWTEMAEFK